MTEKEKVEAYDKALKKASAAYKDEDRHLKATLERIFPELKEEDNDERIKKNCIHFLELQKQHHAATFEIEECIDWLEKQSEQKPQGKSALEAIKEENVDNANKVEPKFKVGDWIASNLSNSSNLLRIIGIDETNYEVVTPQGSTGVPSIRYIDKHFHLWTIEDVRDGNVLVCDIDKAEIGGDVEKLPNIVSTIFIFKKLINSRDYIHSYCHLYDKRFLGLQRTMYYNSFVYNISPATKEQRELLFQKIKEAGYEWNDETKTLEKLVEPKFKIGDWVVFITSGSIYQVEKIENYEYTLRNIHEGLLCVSFSNEKLIREWTIQDAEDGDVIHLGTVTAIFKKYIGREKCICYCSFCKDGGFEIPIENGEDNVYGCCNATPATKEQRDVLMKTMNNAGYEWDTEKKELKKKEK